MAWEVWNVEQLEVEARLMRRLSGAGWGHPGLRGGGRWFSASVGTWK